VNYATRPADNADEAHVNYACPCGCTAGIMYSREGGSLHLGECCCGRLLWLAPDAEAAIRSRFKPGVGYDLDVSSVTLPWGETVVAALAVPARTLTAAEPAHDHGEHGHDHAPAGHEHDHDHGHGHDHDHDHGHEHDHGVHAHGAPARVKDVVCGMLIDPAGAAGSSIYKGRTHYFCSEGCRLRFEAGPEQYLPRAGLLGRLSRILGLSKA
jgi:YHS domain-containing protein